MRFMLLVIPKGYENAAPGTMPEADAVAEMMKFNRALKDAGILRALDGLHPPSMGARVSFKGGKASVTDGPFAETHEVLGGYWIIDVASKEDAVAVRLGLEQDPREHHGLAALEPGQLGKRQQLLDLEVVADRLDVLQCAMLQPHLLGERRDLLVALDVLGRHRDDESVYITHD